MGVELVVPTLGESISEAVVGKWHKKAGDAVKADEPVVVLETDKVTMDVPAPSSGTIESVKFKEGDKVKVGDVLGVIAAGPGATVSQAHVPKVETTKEVSTPASSKEISADSARATPVARNIMEEKGIDPAKVKGTGPGGRIQKEDVLALGSNGAAPAQAKSTPQPSSTPSAPRAKGDREERVRMTPLRKRVAERLLQAQSQAAILTTFNEVDMSGVMALRKQYQDVFVKKHGVKLGFMSFFVKAAVEALKSFPAVNAEIEGEDVVFKHYYDVGVAVSGKRGLVVPVIRDADQQSMAELEKSIAAYGEKAKTDKLTMSDLTGGTFTISNGGIFGSMLSTPILNPPQTGILGMHNIVERAVVRDGEIKIAPIMYLALSYDHRLIDGREAVQFLVKIKDCIEDPQRLLLEI